MGRDYTTSGLLESIERRSGIPVNQSTFTPERVFAFADDEILDTVVPMIRAHRNDHFVTFSDVATTSAVEYEIPDEAMNRGLYNVALLGSDGTPYSLVRIDFDREIEPDAYSWRKRYTRGGLAYFLRGDALFLYPESEAGETLRIYYERLPNRLIPTTLAAKVVSVNTGNGQVTCVSASVPAAWDNGTKLCVVKGTPGFTLRVASTTASAATDTIVTLPTADVADIEADDWIAPLGDSPLIQLPVEAHSVLAQAVAVKLQEAMGDEILPAAREALTAAVARYTSSFPQRVEQAPKRVFSRNRLIDHLRH